MSCFCIEVSKSGPNYDLEVNALSLYTHTGHHTKMVPSICACPLPIFKPDIGPLFLWCRPGLRLKFCAILPCDFKRFDKIPQVKCSARIQSQFITLFTKWTGSKWSVKTLFEIKRTNSRNRFMTDWHLGDILRCNDVRVGKARVNVALEPMPTNPVSILTVTATSLSTSIIVIWMYSYYDINMVLAWIHTCLLYSNESTILLHE